jgi:prevent-host-death family protein
MKYSEQIVPISYLKDNVARIAKELDKTGSPLIVTQNGEARLVVQDIRSYEETQETLALLKILALGEEQIREGRTMPLGDAISKIKQSHKHED